MEAKAREMQEEKYNGEGELDDVMKRVREVIILPMN
jgi:ATP-dependent 26S proteasome regulatory subunit